jgi:hypothetical protein
LRAYLAEINAQIEKESKIGWNHGRNLDGIMEGIKQKTTDFTDFTSLLLLLACFLLPLTVSLPGPTGEPP